VAYSPLVQPDGPFFVPESAVEVPSPNVRREDLDHGCLAAPRSEVLIQTREQRAPQPSTTPPWRHVKFQDNPVSEVDDRQTIAFLPCLDSPAGEAHDMAVLLRNQHDAVALRGVFQHLTDELGPVPGSLVHLPYGSIAPISSPKASINAST
jgi:hypothetical protein